jgi:hypothetical protein
MSHSPMAAPALAPALVQQAAPQVDLAIPINIQATVTDLRFESGQLLATLQIAGQTLEDVPLDLTIDFGDGTGCPILNVEIPEGLHVDLLGLNIDTSGICLNISGQEGQLLGDLLCGISGLLDDGGLLDDLLGSITGPVSLTDLLDTVGTIGESLGLTPAQIDTLVNGILDSIIGVVQPALDSALGSLFTAPTLSGVDVSGTGGGGRTGDCDILNLDIGPIDLNLLGLVVELDNCEDGPVEVDITAEPGSGKLLGNLLCGVSRLLDSNAADAALGARLNKIGRVIDRLI